MAEKAAGRVPVPGMMTPMPPFVHQSGMIALPQVKQPDEIDEFSKDMVSSMARAQKLAMIRDTLKPAEPQRQDNSAMGEAFKAMAVFNQGLTNQMTEIFKTNASAQNNSALMAMQQQVQKLSDRLENAGKGGQVSDMEIFFNGMSRMEAMGQILKKSLGIPDQVQTSVSDISGMLQLKKMELDSLQSQQQHNERMALMQRQWQVEDRRDTQKMKLDIIRLSDEREGKKNNSRLLEDLLGSIMEGLDFTPEEKNMLGIAGRPQADQPPAPAPAFRGARPKVKQFTCQVCGQVIQVPNPDVDQVVCPNEQCRTIYDLNPQEKPSAPPPVEIVDQGIPEQEVLLQEMEPA